MKFKLTPQVCKYLEDQGLEIIPYVSFCTEHNQQELMISILGIPKEKMVEKLNTIKKLSETID